MQILKIIALDLRFSDFTRKKNGGTREESVQWRWCGSERKNKTQKMHNEEEIPTKWLERKRKDKKGMTTEEMRGCCKGGIHKCMWARNAWRKNDESIKGNLEWKEVPKGIQQNVLTSVVINSLQLMICAFTLTGLLVNDLKLRFLFNTLYRWHWLNKWPLCRIVMIKMWKVNTWQKPAAMTIAILCNKHKISINSNLNQTDRFH